MKLKYLIVLLFVANAFSAKNTNKTIVNIEMMELARTIEGIFPYMFDAQKFDSASGQKKITKSLDKMITTVVKARPHFDQSSINFQISYELLKHQLEEAKALIGSPHKVYAREMVKDIPKLCVSCHAQSSKKIRAFTRLKRDKFPNDFEFAQYNASLRDFTKAIEYYEKVLISSEAHRVKQKALRRILAIKVKDQVPLEKLEVDLKSYRTTLKLPSYLNNEIDGWLKSLPKIKIVSKDSWKNLKKDIVIYMANRSQVDQSSLFEVNALSLMNRLYKILPGLSKSDDVSESLYWLGLLENEVSYSGQYNLSNLYLLECMKTYKDTEYGKKCYIKYKSNIQNSFTGSSGVDKKEVSEELKKLEQFVPKVRIMEWNEEPINSNMK